MRGVLLAACFLIGVAGAAPANVITSTYTSFYVLGDSLSDDGNLPGPVWWYATGGSPYSGSFWSGGTFTNGKVWNQSIQSTFRNAGRDADNYAVAKAQSSGGSWLFPDLGGQIQDLLDDTSSRQRGSNSLASIWIGANNVIDALTSGGDAISAAVSAARRVASGARSLTSRAGIDDFLIFNLPDLGRTPMFNLFQTSRKAAATAASRAYNAELARNIVALEAEGKNVIPVDIFGLFQRAIDNPLAYGFKNATLPCVFPSSSLARQYGKPTRCSSDTAKTLLFIDQLHPNALAHGHVRETALAAIQADLAAGSRLMAVAQPFEEPGPLVVTPLPGGAVLLLTAAAATVVVGRRRAA